MSDMIGPPKPYHLRNYVRGAEAAARQRRQMARTGETFAGQQLWTDVEIEICRSTDPGYKAIKRKLRRRTLIAIQRKCNELGLVPERTAWTGADVARLRRMYPAASHKELFDAFPGRTLRSLKHAANSRGIIREKKPYKITVHAPLDQLRQRCFEQGYVMPDIDQNARSKKHFQKATWCDDWFSTRFVARAVKALGGKLTIEWRDDD